MTAGPATYTGRPAGASARRVLAVLLVLAGSALALLALAAHFVHNDLLDTDRYVESVGPLADDPRVQAEVSAEVTDRIADAVNLDELGPLTSAGAEAAVRDAVRSALASEEFSEVWVESNRTAHEEFVAVVTARDGDVVTGGQGGVVTLRLDDLLTAAGDPFAEFGVSLSDVLQDVEVEVVVIESDALAAAQRFVPWLDPIAGVAPWITLAAWAGALLVAPRGARAGTLAGIGLGATVAGAAVLIGVDIGRSRYLDSLPPDGLPPAAVASMYDALTDPLLSRAWVVLIGGAALAVVGFIASLVTGRRVTPR